MKALATLLAVALLGAPTVGAAQTAWISSFVDEPPEAKVAAFVWLAAGCQDRAKALINNAPNAMAIACDETVPISPTEYRRIVELGVMTGVVNWCEPDVGEAELSTPWLVAVLDRANTDLKGKAWPDQTTSLYASRLTGVASGYTMTLLQRGAGDCTPEQKIVAHRDLDAWLARDKAAHPAG